MQISADCRTEWLICRIYISSLSYSVNELNLYLLCGVSSDNDLSQPRSVLLNRQFSAQLNYGQTPGQQTKTLHFLEFILQSCYIRGNRQKNPEVGAFFREVQPSLWLVINNTLDYSWNPMKRSWRYMMTILKNLKDLFNDIPSCYS